MVLKVILLSDASLSVGQVLLHFIAVEVEDAENVLALALMHVPVCQQEAAAALVQRRSSEEEATSGLGKLLAVDQFGVGGCQR